MKWAALGSSSTRSIRIGRILLLDRGAVGVELEDDLLALRRLDLAFVRGFAVLHHGLEHDDLPLLLQRGSYGCRRPVDIELFFDDVDLPRRVDHEIARPAVDE